MTGRYIIVTIVGFCLSYCAGAFIIWEINPALWTADQRLGMVLFSIVFIIPSMVFLHVWHDFGSMLDSTYKSRTHSGPIGVGEE